MRRSGVHADQLRSPLGEHVTPKLLACFKPARRRLDLAESDHPVAQLRDFFASESCVAASARSSRDHSSTSQAAITTQSACRPAAFGY